MPVAIPDAVFQVDKAILLFIQNNLRYPALTPFLKQSPITVSSSLGST